ncbi:hypothetical protein PtrSN002B_005438 [Pyrenophora tritici-repentis]|nr:hypothetical protein A1F99_081980 [Pyrenophora tritici-repentis]KAI0586015.1 hypothetical protein Alg215_02217 [Pyrenophora tritici-repentis]KAI0589048.1 hypothetical protein Alg130_03104 [Pyrenophora tritici-repentis]KAI0612659.1 hypothetical protein TUN205_03092 [Pyrenophora tritici-repentis]KAI0624813.1 hypothetical protein TUN199_03183 [Pyrenophora tritici-repentis]
MERNPMPIPKPPPTWGEKQIEVARRRTLLNYHVPTSPHSFVDWHRTLVIVPHIATKVEDLLPIAANSALLATPPVSDLEILYTRILTLYNARLAYIQAEGARRMSMWADWWHETSKPSPHCNEAEVNACISTIAFLEDDYLKRKVEFVAEIHALLEPGDKARADAVLEDLEILYPVLKDTGFLKRVMEGDGGAFVGLRGKLPQV